MVDETDEFNESNEPEDFDDMSEDNLSQDHLFTSLASQHVSQAA